MLWTMILIGCKLFLRSDELTDKDGLKLSSICKDYSLVREDGIIKALAIKVVGKSDKKPVILMLWADESNILLCPVVHLLIWMYYIEHKDGPLFPTSQELNTATDGVFKTSYSYHSLHNDVKKLFCGWSFWDPHYEKDSLPSCSMGGRFRHGYRHKREA